MRNSLQVVRYRSYIYSGLLKTRDSLGALVDAARQRRRSRLQLEGIRELSTRQREDIGLPPLAEIEHLTMEATQSHHRTVRLLHWVMAVGFVLMWVTGVIVTNVEGVPFFVEDDRQGVIRDLHKSIGLTLLFLLAIRLVLRFTLAAPPLPNALSALERRRAHWGHAMLYVTIGFACVTGYAIADLQNYGNAYFGIELPKLFPTIEYVAGWAVAPWSYVLHALLAYGLLALTMGHIGFVVLHKRLHGVDLLSRMAPSVPTSSDGRLLRLAATAGFIAVVIVVFAVRAFVTLGPVEEPRDYITTTPFHHS